MGKDSRLSFRISSLLDERIEKAIDKSGGQIRDRSELGTKSIKFYLDFIENTKSENEVILEAILALANNVGVKGEEITKIDQLMEEKAMIPGEFVSGKHPQDHPEFSKLMGILEKSKDNTNFYKELSTKLRDAAYEDVEDLYKTYSEKFLLTS